MKGVFFMAIDFNKPANRFTYSTREADHTWIDKVNEICEVKGKKVLDIGCGGGIYTKALAKMGAAEVMGLDFSEQLLHTAKENCRDYDNINFKLGNALDTKLADEQYDIILERAVIHHIDDLNACFQEGYRLLKPGGVFLIQDRTPEDCLLKGSATNIRGYFFEKYPSLIDKEISRRYPSHDVMQFLKENGFHPIEEYSLWETRKVYQYLDDLMKDIKNRTGRSILYELNDEQVDELAVYIKDQINSTTNNPITEKDRWTIWKGIKS